MPTDLAKLEAAVLAKYSSAEMSVSTAPFGSAKSHDVFQDDISAWEYYLPPFEDFGNAATSESKSKRPALQEAEPYQLESQRYWHFFLMKG